MLDILLLILLILSYYSIIGLMCNILMVNRVCICWIIDFIHLIWFPYSEWTITWLSYTVWSCLIITYGFLHYISSYNISLCIIKTFNVLQQRFINFLEILKYNHTLSRYISVLRWSVSGSWEENLCYSCLNSL